MNTNFADFETIVEQIGKRGRPWFRVTVRGFQDRAEARQAARTLARRHRLEPVIVAIRA